MVFAGSRAGCCENFGRADSNHQPGLAALRGNWRRFRPEGLCLLLPGSGPVSAAAARHLRRSQRAPCRCETRPPQPFGVERCTSAEETISALSRTLDKLDEPDSLVKLRAAVNSRLPRVDLPEVLLEIAARTDFTAKFTHVSERESRMQDHINLLGRYAFSVPDSVAREEDVTVR